MSFKSTRMGMGRLFTLAAVVTATLAWPHSTGLASLAAFPGAEGEGMYVTGGRGGEVYHVTNLNDTGPGSLRYGVTTGSVARYVVFDVGGTIALSSGLNVSRGNITIAGQTAPGAGICISDYGVGIGATNVIMQHLRIRPGDACKGPGGMTEDSLNIASSNVIVDHCSTSWGIDENLSCNASSPKNITVQYCIVAEGLDQTGLYHGAWDINYYPGGSEHHSMGSLIKPMSGSGLVTYHHNLYASNYNRNPCLGDYTADVTLQCDFRNNVIYNCYKNGYGSGESQRIDLNYVGNYVISGPETSGSWNNRAFDANATCNFNIYQSGNKIDGDKDSLRDGVDTGWGMFSGSSVKLTTPVSMKPVTTQSADDAYNTVLAQSGAFYWNRDSVDERLVNNVLTNTGKIIDSQNEVGGYPVIPTDTRPADWDTDKDGMPNWWELACGTNPNAYDQNLDVDRDGRNNLEEYLYYASVPEPATLTLLMAGGAAILRRRKTVRRAGS